MPRGLDVGLELSFLGQHHCPKDSGREMEIGSVVNIEGGYTADTFLLGQLGFLYFSLVFCTYIRLLFLIT